METLIDKIYEAAAAPELWPSVLQSIGQVAGAKGALLYAASSDKVNWLSSPDLYADSAAYFDSGLASSDARTNRLVALAHPGFVTDFDVFTPEEFEHYSVNAKVLRPRGLGWGVATAINSPNGLNAVVHCERRFESGPYQQGTVARLNVLRPHLARAVLLSSELDMLKAQATVSALQMLDLPAAVLGHRGDVRAVNGAMACLIPDVVRDGRSRMNLADRSADVLLGQALDNQARRLERHELLSIPVKATGEHPPMVVHLVPICGVGQDILFSSRCVAIITPLSTSSALAPSLLQGLFDLTPAEAAVAALVAQGTKVSDISAIRITSEDTIRSQLKSVMKKTGCSRQVEIALLLSGCVVPQARL